MKELQLGHLYSSISILHVVVWYYVLSFLFIIIIGLLSWFLWDKRVRDRHGKVIPESYIRTEEVSIDPRTGETLRVYYNPENGKRFYHQE